MDLEVREPEAKINMPETNAPTAQLRLEELMEKNLVYKVILHGNERSESGNLLNMRTYPDGVEMIIGGRSDQGVFTLQLLIHPRNMSFLYHAHEII